MIVFKNYFKIVLRFWPAILMYVGIFTFFAVVATASNTTQGTFSAAKPNVAIINHDTSVLTESFIKYITENSNIVELEDSEEILRDALFYREADYIFIIPEDFGATFTTNPNIKIETMKVPNSSVAFYSEMLFNRFWNIAKVYKMSGMNEEQISNVILNDLKPKAEVTFLDSKQNELQNVMYFYNFSNYTILATCIFIVGMISNIFNNEHIKKRNTISTVSYKNLNRQLFLGNMITTILLWLIYIGISIILYGSLMFTANGLLIMLNTLVFSLTALSTGFLVGNLVQNKEAQNGVVNVIALGTSFICGAFVPQEMLGNFVLGIAKIFPSYWFIKNNEDIINLSNVNISTLEPIFINMVIVLLFGIAFFLITNRISRAKLKR